MKRNTNRWLSACVSMLLVLCMFITMPAVAKAAEPELDVTEEEVVMYYEYAQQIVDNIVPHIKEFPVFKGYSTNSTVKDKLIIPEIVNRMDDYEDMIIEIGFEPTDENKEFLAEEIYNVACVYYEEEHRSGGTAESADRLAVLEVVRFALVEVKGLSNEDAVVVAAKYYDVYIANTASYRIAGANRYETGIEVANEMKAILGIDKFDTIVVSCGTGFADALSGSYLAAKKSAPILLVNQHASIYQSVVDYIAQNLVSGGTVYILGGEAAVPAAFEAALTNCKVIRLAGKDRYETSLRVLQEAGVSTAQDILVCTGKAFADSLSASATGLPILLVRGDKELTEAHKSYLEYLGNNSKFVVIGGASAVNEKIFEQLDAYGSVERLGGANRFETSTMIASRYFPKSEKAVLAFARKYPDGLCGGPLAYTLKAPLILTRGGNEATAVAYASNAGVHQGYVLGGPDLIGDASVRTIFDMEDFHKLISK